MNVQLVASKSKDIALEGNSSKYLILAFAPIEFVYRDLKVQTY